MSKPYYWSKPDTHNRAETNTPASVSSRGETTDKAKQWIAETFKPGKWYDAEMETKFGKEPSEQDVIAKFAGQKKFKGKNYQEILAQLDQDENKPMADRLRKKVKGWSQHMNSEQENKALAKAWYGTDEGWIKPLDEKAKKKIEANKSTDMTWFNVTSKEKLQVWDIVIAQPTSKWENPVFRNKRNGQYECINYPGASAWEARIQALKREDKWHEVVEKDLKPEEKKIETPKPEAPKPVVETQHVTSKLEAQKVEKFADEKKSKGWFFKKAAKGTWKVIARPFKKSRQAIKRPFGKSAKNKDKKGIHNTRIGRAVTRPVRKSRDIVSGVGGHARGTLAGAAKYQREWVKKMWRRLVKPFKRKNKWK